MIDTLQEADNNLKIVQQDTTILDSVMDPKSGMNHSARTFTASNTVAGQVRVKADKNNHSPNDHNKQHK